MINYGCWLIPKLSLLNNRMLLFDMVGLVRLLIIMISCALLFAGVMILVRLVVLVLLRCLCRRRIRIVVSCTLIRVRSLVRLTCILFCLISIVILNLLMFITNVLRKLGHGYWRLRRDFLFDMVGIMCVF